MKIASWSLQMEPHGFPWGDWLLWHNLIVSTLEEKSIALVPSSNVGCEEHEVTAKWSCFVALLVLFFRPHPRESGFTDSITLGSLQEGFENLMWSCGLNAGQLAARQTTLPAVLCFWSSEWSSMVSSTPAHLWFSDGFSVSGHRPVGSGTLIPCYPK